MLCEDRTVAERHFLHYCFLVNECNSRLHQQTKRPSRLKKTWGSSLKTRRLFDPRVCFSSTAPLSTEQNYLLYLYCSFPCSPYCHLYLAEDFKHFWSVGMKSAKSVGPGCDFYSPHVCILDEGLIAEVVVSVSELKWLLFFNQDYLFWCKTVTASQEKTLSKSPHCDVFFVFYFKYQSNTQKTVQ